MPAAIPSTQSRIVLVNRPKAAISPDITSGNGTFLLQKNAPVEQPGQGECLIKVEWVSLDPAMRGWLNDSRSYIEPVKLQAVMRALGVGKLVSLGQDAETKKAAEKKGLRVGDWVSATCGWQEYAKMPVREVTRIHVDDKILVGLARVQHDTSTGIESLTLRVRLPQPTYHLTALGMVAQTAYWGLKDVGQIKPTDVVVVSGAAGAVGSIAVQIAKAAGCKKLIAIAGGKEKCRYLKEELGVDVALDYKDPNFKKDFRKVGYVDVYFDNVGGEILDLVLTRLNKFARIALCGAISAYNDPNPRGLQMYLTLISQSAQIRGFVVFDYAKRYKEAEDDLLKWISEGRLKVKEHRSEGLENCVDGLLGLFKGENTGKAVVRIGAPDSKL
ncbi:BZ3500_MvSof-1268-A1-R1_Chr2-2g04752 [Microbotryum saponariae]|uniref:BZ3500_MvSof-1268-A1-R1_Chr2-2g04752 protein n=1 Tax=Microbotryum saponariae TaxID=289078 RepID=A0A2X0LM23_9BASI|nr:BZ3500_MvSof-1268-A1-R1_Chr2-2g04752 [Microbotryum saponariae]SDA00073.1 BZ3501_MvSof-1269-A2-R1_Chr2-2g04426 [Microbotryum saponariae]